MENGSLRTMRRDATTVSLSRFDALGSSHAASRLQFVERVQQSQADAGRKALHRAVVDAVLRAGATESSGTVLRDSVNASCGLMKAHRPAVTGPQSQARRERSHHVT